jgi:hypothetical protein
MFYVETKATNFHLHQKLRRLTTSYREGIEGIVQDLAAGSRETSTDLMVCLFDAYKSVEDTAFH